MIQQHGLRTHHVCDGDHWEPHRVGFTGRRIEDSRAARSHAATQNICANDEVAIRINWQTLPHQAPPPAGPARHRVLRRYILIHRQRVADEDDVRFIRVHPPIGFIGDVDRRERGAAVQPQGTGQADLAAEAETAVIGEGCAGHGQSGLGPWRGAVNRRGMV